MWIVAVMLDQDTLDRIVGPFATKDLATQWCENHPDGEGFWGEIHQVEAP